MCLHSAVPFALLLVLASGATAQTSEPTQEATDELVCVFDDRPVLIGGLKGLQDRLVCPQIPTHLEGTVFVQFLVTPSGEVKKPTCVRSPHPLMCEAAIDAVNGARFEPGTQRGVPVRVRFTLPVRFDHC